MENVVKATSRRHNSFRGQVPSLETLEARELLSAFASIAGAGNWSALSTWATQDGGAVTHIPGAGDTVTINGQVTVDVATIVGTGTGDAITFANSSTMGAKKLSVAAPLTVEGSILSQGKCVVDVLAGQGIEFDAAAGVQPKLHAPSSSQLNLYVHGTADSRCYIRTKVGTAGQPAIICADNWYIVTNIGATYTDFTNINGGPNASSYPGNFYTAYGLLVQPDSGALMRTMDNCTFTATTLYIDLRSAGTAAYTVSNSYFDQCPLVSYGDTKVEAFFIGANHLNLNGVGFDQGAWLERMGSIQSCVFAYIFINTNGGTPYFTSWADTVDVVVDQANGYFKAQAGTYNRMYTIVPGYAASNPHMMDGGANTTFSDCLWDVPTAHDVDDALMMLGNFTRNVNVTGCLALPSIGGPYPGAGPSMGYTGGTNIKYDHDTIALGKSNGITADPNSGHGGVTGGVAEFKSNIGFTADGNTAGGALIYTFGGLTDLVSAANCDYNAKYRCSYNMAETGTPGAHDVNGQNPNFIDPTRDLTNYYRTHSGVTPGPITTDVQASVDWIRKHPALVPAMIAWVRNGYIPTNLAYKAAADNVAPTNGWIGAMRGVPVADANLDGVTNFQDYIVLERNFGQANMGWEGGDFNNDGVVNFQDYIILERNFGTSYVSAAPAQNVATPVELAASITPGTATDVPAATPVMGPIAPLYVLNGPATAAGTSPTLFSSTGPVASPTAANAGPTLRSVTWPKAQKWQLPPVKGAMGSMMVDLFTTALA